MKKFILTLGLVAGMSALTFGQSVDIHKAGDGHNHDAPTQAPANPTSEADIKMDKMVHDYGNIQQGANGVCEFKFTNNGKEPLVISNCAGSCGCTVPECPNAPILPGKSGIIKVKYDTNRPGPIYKTVTVTSNAKSGNVVLSIKGNVEQKKEEETFPQGQTPAGAPADKKG